MNERAPYVFDLLSCVCVPFDGHVVDSRFFFFFQAEDGIRDIGVTGVQTCALPISRPKWIRESARKNFCYVATWCCGSAQRLSDHPGPSSSRARSNASTSCRSSMKAVAP